MTESTSWGNLYRKYCRESRVQELWSRNQPWQYLQHLPKLPAQPYMGFGVGCRWLSQKIRFQILGSYTTEEQIKYIQATVPLAQYAIKHKHLQHAKYSIASSPLSLSPPGEAKVTSFYTPFHFMLIWAITGSFHTAGCTFIHGTYHGAFSNKLPKDRPWTILGQMAETLSRVL